MSVCISENQISSSHIPGNLNPSKNRGGILKTLRVASCYCGVLNRQADVRLKSFTTTGTVEHSLNYVSDFERDIALRGCGELRRRGAQPVS